MISHVINHSDQRLTTILYIVFLEESYANTLKISVSFSVVIIQVQAC